MGFQAIWLQWIQSVALYPSLFSFAAASLAYAIGRSDLATNGFYTGAVVLIIFWAATLIALRGLGAMARVSSWGAIVGTLIPAAALIALMVVWLASGKPSQAPLHASSIVPPFAGLAGIVLIVSNFIALGGLEVSAVHIRDMRRPVSDYLKAVTVAVVLGLLVYIPGTVAVAVAVPTKQIDLNAGAAQAFANFTAGLGIGWLGPLLSALLLVGALAALAGIGIGLIPPSQLDEGSHVLYTLGLIVGVLLLAVPPQIIYRLRRPAWRAASSEAAAGD